MDPATLAVISTVATVAGTVINSQGAKQSGEAQAQASLYQAQVAKNNQQIADNYAAQEEARGRVLAQQKQQETGQRVGAIAAATGASGLDPEGSPLRLTADTLSLGDLDARTIRYNAEKAAYGYKVQGTSYGAQAGLDMATAENVRAAGNLSSMSSIISGGAQVADKWSRYKMTGVGAYGGGEVS